MKPWHGALLLVAGFAAGFVAAPRGDPAGADTLRQERDALKTRAERAEADLAAGRDAKPRRPREGVDLPKGAVAADSREPFEEPKPGAPPKPEAPPSAEARAKRLNEIRGALAGYFSAHEGEKVLAALKELAALGPEARDDAMKLAIDINADVNGPGDLRLSMFTFYSGLGDPAVRDLMIWSLDNQASSPPGFRVMSAYSVPWVVAKPDEAIARFETALAHEGDRSVQNAIVANLGSMNTPKAESVLARVFADATRDAALRAEAAMALAGSKDPAIQRDIDTAAASDPDPRVQNAAKLALVVRDPPATGCLVMQTLPESNADAAGIKAGDVLVSYNGRAVPTADDLRREIGAASGAETFPVVVVRDGREQTIQVKPGRLGLPNLRPVAKK